MAYMEMLEGRAVGGPRNGVKLAASIKWDGRVAKPGGNNSGFYPGRYKWNGATWRWYLDQAKPKSIVRSRKRAVVKLPW